MAVSNATSAERAPYDDYVSQRAALDSCELAVSERFDRNVLAVASGALGLSLTFLEKLAATPKVSTRWILFSAWTLLLVSIVASLTSLLTSQSAIRRVRGDLDERQRSGLSEQRSNPYAHATNWLNIGSLVALIAGVFMLCWFNIANTQWSGVSP